MNFRGMCLTVVFTMVFFSMYAYGWGPLTHMSLVLESRKRAGLRMDHGLDGAFLAGCTEPDIGAAGSGMTLGSGTGDAISATYGVYHDPVFVESMIAVAKRKQGKARQKLLAKALGYESHLIGDSVAHTGSGYPNTKVVFDKLPKNEYLLNHITTEFFVDLLCYRKHKKEIDALCLEFVDADTLAEVIEEYAVRKGIEIKVDKKKLKRDILKHKATIVTQVTLYNYIMRKRPNLVKEIDAFFGDRFDGVNGKGGINQSLDKHVKFYREDPESLLKEMEVQGPCVPFPANVARTFNDVIKLVTEKMLENGIKAGETLLLASADMEVVRPLLKQVIDEKLLKSRSKSDRLLARLLMNVFFEKDMGFKEAIFDAQKFLVPTELDRKIKELEIEVEFLKQKMDKAYREWQNRPFWKFWLFFTNSDKKKYLTLKAEYERKLADLKRLRSGNEIPLPGSGTIVRKNLNPKEKLREKMKAAYIRWVNEGMNMSSATYQEYLQFKSQFKNLR